MLKKYNSSWHQNRKLGNILSVHVSSPFPSSNPIMFPTMTIKHNDNDNDTMTIPPDNQSDHPRSRPSHPADSPTSLFYKMKYKLYRLRPSRWWSPSSVYNVTVMMKMNIREAILHQLCIFLTLLQIFYYTKGFLATWNWLLSIYNVQGLFCQDNNYNWYCDNR